MSDTSLQGRELHEPRWLWWLVLAMGLVSIAAGIIVVAKPSDSLKALAVIFGIFILLDGIVELVGALGGATENRGLLGVIGVLSVIAGVLLIRHPLGGVRAVALILGIWLIAAGLARFIVAFDSGEHRLWRIAVAVILVVVGLAVVSDPHIGYGTLALIAGIGFIAYGLSMVAAGWALHVVRESERGAPITRDASAMT